MKFTTQSIPVSNSDFSGGLNSTSGPLNVKDNEATDLQNIDFNKFGSFVKRNGFTRLNSSALDGGVTGLHWFQEVSGTDSLIAVAGTKIYYDTDVSGTFTDITGGLTVTDDDNLHWDFATFNDQVGACNGTDAPFKISNALAASAMTLPTNVTVPKYIEAFNNYTFIAVPTLSGTVQSTRVYWSNIDKLDTWTNTDFADIGLDDGDTITGMKVLGDSLIIFKERSIWRAEFTGDADIPFVFRKTPSDVGCITVHSVQEIQNGLKFLSQDGFYFFDGSNSIKVSDRITATLDLFTRNRFQNAVSVYQREKNRYWCSFTTSGQTQHNRVVTWDSANNAYSFYKGHAANAYAIVFITGQERVYFGDYAGRIYRGDTSEDDQDTSGADVAINAFYKTKWYNFGDLVDKKGIAHATIFHQIDSNTISFSYSYDFEEADQYSKTVDLSTSGSVYGTATYGTGTYAGSGGLGQRIDLTGRGRVIRFHFSNSALDEGFQIDGLGLLPHLETNA